MKFVRLNMDTARFVLCTYASFANGRDLKSQLGFIVLLMDHTWNAKMQHHGSNRCRRVTRSVMASEMHALVLGFDFAFIMKSLVEDVTGRRAPMEAYVD